MSTSGVQQWTKLMGSANDEATTAIDISTDGSIYTTGWSDVDPNLQTKDVLLVKHSKDGNLA